MVRDTPGLAEVGFPVFARGTTPNSPQKDGPGEINVPVVCGGIMVQPGDIVVGDVDGVVVVPKDRAQEVIEKVKAIGEKEAGIRASIRANRGLPDSAIQMLKEKGPKQRISTEKRAIPNRHCRMCDRNVVFCGNAGDTNGLADAIGALRAL